MNFLAHIFLSGSDEGRIIGNFIGDFVKGKEVNNYSKEIRKGILLHRSIDEYTDSHEVVIQSKIRLRPKYRHYAPVIVDLYYDHFLAHYWENFSAKALKDFTSGFYELTGKYDHVIPQRAKHMLHYMANDDWLYNYQFLIGLEKALTGLSRRTSYDSKMDEAIDDLKENYDAFKHEFYSFFPDLQSHAKNFIEQKL